MGTTIVCALDTDDAGATEPLFVSADLAQRLGLPLVVASVLQPGPFPSGGPAIEEGPAIVAPAPALAYQHPVMPEGEQLEAARAEMRRRVEQRIAETPVADDAQIEVAVDADIPAGLRRIAADLDADLLVVGSRGRGTIKAALLGSTSHALVADAPCPVVVVPPRD